MKKSNSIVVGIVVLVVIIGGGYALFHKSSKTMPTTASSTSSQSNAPAVNNAVLITKTNSSVGQYLTDPSGNTLYTYASDSSGVSNCTGSCLTAWPAYQDKGSTSNLPTGVSTIKRTDNGQIQYTYNGMPLYYFANDSAGQVTGNGVQNFTAAKPAASTTTQSTSTPATTSPSQSNTNNSSGNPY
jgi:predicted lipoprotein with Yx(FWY)xxD motif